MSNNIIEEMNKRKEKRKTAKYILIVSLIVLIAVYFSFITGRKIEVKENYYADEEILMTTIYGDIGTVTFLLDRSDEWDEEIDTLTKYNGSYVQLLIEFEQLKQTLELGDMIMYNRGKKLPLHNLVDSIDRSLYVIEGFEYNDEKISNNFFDDGALNESEKIYMRELYEDYSHINENMIVLKDGRNEMISLDQFIELVESFQIKYDMRDSLFDLKVDN